MTDEGSDGSQDAGSEALVSLDSAMRVRAGRELRYGLHTGHPGSDERPLRQL
ncbi:MAG: hypothetical protein MZU97_08775 [Bacillus subtilis]|nr:hypothetical protein [Bacillus subtilis]